MGVVYCGPYAELVGDCHEGSAVQVSVDRRLSVGRAEGETAWLAGCGCGWRGLVPWPAGVEGEAEALAEWDRDHLQPLIAAAAARWEIWSVQVAEHARTAAAHVEAGRPDRAVLVLARLADAVQTYLRVADGLAEEKIAADLAEHGSEGAD